MKIHLHKQDLPSDISFGESVAVDSETMGLQYNRDRLCLVQLSDGNGDAHLVQFAQGSYEAPNLTALLEDEKTTKIFHYARFDVAMFQKYLGVHTHNIFCTKIASKLVRTYTNRHGLKDLCKELIGVDISKAQQCSDWGAAELSPDQEKYAASDVLYLHLLKDRLVEILEREGRIDLAYACFEFLNTRATLDLLGWEDPDIFAHSA